MKRLTVFAVVALLIFSLSPAWAAPVTEQLYFTKQTNLTPATYTFRLSLWDVVSGGTASPNRVWWEVKSLNMTNSTLTTYLGSVVAAAQRSGSISNVDFSEQLWVQVEKKEANGTYTVVGPRTRLLVVPYALWSKNAAGGPIMVYNTSSASTLIGTSCTNYAGSVVSITVPGPGVISVEANANLNLQVPQNYPAYKLNFMIGTSVTDCGAPIEYQAAVQLSASVGGNWSIHSARIFNVSTPGTYTYFLNGITSSSYGGQSSFNGSNIKAVFYPN